MAGQTSDKQFKAEMLDFKSAMLDFKTEVMRFVEVANQKFDGLTADVRTNSFKLDRLESEHGKRFDTLDAGLKVVSGRQNDVIPKVIGIQKTVNRISDEQAAQTFKMIEMVNRLDGLERYLQSLDERAIQTESEVKDIRGVTPWLTRFSVDRICVPASARSIRELQTSRKN